MGWIEWLLPSGGIVVVLATLWHIIRQILTNSVSSKVSSIFEKQLEELRGDLNRRERQLVAQLNADQAQIEALRTGALTGATNRNVVLTQKKIEAAEKIWSATIELRRLAPIAQLMTVIKYESAADGAKNDPAIKDMFEQLAKGYDTKVLTEINASNYRLFLSKKAWAYFDAYQAILLDSLMQFLTIKLGVGSKLYRPHALYDDLKKKLPEFSDVIEKGRTTSLYFMLGPLEDFLLQELQNTLTGRTDDQHSVSSALEIVRLSTQLQQVFKSPEGAQIFANLPSEVKREQETQAQIPT